jgi:hypothetical protein
MKQNDTVKFSIFRSSTQMLRDSVFVKKNTVLDIPDHEITEEPSRRMIATSVFPDPRRIQPTFDLSDLESLLPLFWQEEFERAEDGEILLTEEQVNLFVEPLLERRTNQLVEMYTKCFQNFVAQYNQAKRVGVGLPPESQTPWV